MDLVVRHLLWIDCVGGLTIGSLVLATTPLLSDWYHLPPQLIFVLGITNLAYGCFSLSLAVRDTRPRFLICLLAVANIGWAPVCFALTTLWWPTITVWGAMHLIGEGCYVGALGALEWRLRERLAAGS
jgi:hypothetical protein